MNKKDWERYIYGLDVAPTGTKLVNFKAVALCMAYHSDWNTLKNVSVSIQTIAKETSLHRNTVDKVINAMMDTGLAIRHKEKRVWSTAGGTKWTWVYDLHIMDSHIDVIPLAKDDGMDSHFEQMDSHIDVIPLAKDDGMDSHFEQMDSHFGQMDSHFQQMDSHFGQMDSQIDVNNHTYNHTKDHTNDHTSNHTAQDGDGNRGCDETEPTGTQTASQQSPDSTKGDTPSPDSSEATARAVAAPTSQEATRDETEPKDNATASLDLKTNAADSKTSSAESDPKTSSAESWQEMVDADARKERLMFCPVCNEPLNKSDKKKWCPQTDCLRRNEDGPRVYEIDELVEPKTSAEAEELLKMKRQASEWI